MDTLPRLQQLIDFKGKTAIVTGGAMGIGFGIAYRLAEAGANVIIADLNEEIGNKAVKELNGMSPKICNFILLYNGVMKGNSYHAQRKTQCQQGSQRSNT